MTDEFSTEQQSRVQELVDAAYKRGQQAAKGNDQIKMYRHGDKDSNWAQSEELGLSGEAARNFSYALLEVEFDVVVNFLTGDVEIIKVDGRTLEASN